MSTRALYKFHVDCGRMGSLTGTFTATAEEVAKAVGKDLYFDEPFGKHSELSLTLEAEHFKMLTDEQDFVEKFDRFQCWSGTDPIGMLKDEGVL